MRRRVNSRGVPRGRPRAGPLSYQTTERPVSVPSATPRGAGRGGQPGGRHRPTGQPREVPARTSEAPDQPLCDGVVGSRHDDGDRGVAGLIGRSINPEAAMTSTWRPRMGDTPSRRGGRPQPPPPPGALAVEQARAGAAAGPHPADPLARRRADSLELLTLLTTRIEHLDAQITAAAAADRRVRLLLTHPGVGALTALTTVLVLGRRALTGRSEHREPRSGAARCSTSCHQSDGPASSDSAPCPPSTPRHALPSRAVIRSGSPDSRMRRRGADL